MDTMKYLMASAGFLFALQPGSADAQSVQWMQDSTLQGMSGPGCAEVSASGDSSRLVTMMIRSTRGSAKGGPACRASPRSRPKTWAATSPAR